MPADHGVRLEDDESLPPAAPPTQHGPEQAIALVEALDLRRSVQHRPLVSEGQVLKDQVAARQACRENRIKQGRDACDTNVGERRAGQGIASLQQAIYAAGGRTSLTSLWKVPDQATRELMGDFYRRFWVQGKPKRQALGEAQERMRLAKDELGGVKNRVRDWAAWVLVGEG